MYEIQKFFYDNLIFVMYHDINIILMLYLLELHCHQYISKSIYILLVECSNKSPIINYNLKLLMIITFEHGLQTFMFMFSSNFQIYT